MTGGCGTSIFDLRIWKNRPGETFQDRPGFAGVEFCATSSMNCIESRAFLYGLTAMAMGGLTRNPEWQENPRFRSGVKAVLPMSPEACGGDGDR